MLQFSTWALDDDKQLLLALVQSALRSFLENVDESFKCEHAKLYDRELENTDVTGRRLNEQEFVEYIFSYIRNFPSELFQIFLLHLTHCSDASHKAAKRNAQRHLFSDLFQKCDHGKTGFLDRQRIISLLGRYYDSASENIKFTLQNPRQWPISEVDDLKESEFLEGCEYEEEDIEASEEVNKVLRSLQSPQEVVMSSEITAVAPFNFPKEDSVLNSDHSSMVQSPLEQDIDMLTRVKRTASEESKGIINNITIVEQVEKKQQILQDVPLDEGGSPNPNEFQGLQEACAVSVNKNEQDISSKSQWKEHDAITARKASTSTSTLEAAPLTHKYEGIWKKPEQENHMTADLERLNSDFALRSQKEQSIAASRFTDLYSIITDIQSRNTSPVTSVHSDHALNLPQFVQLMETFVGEDTPSTAVDSLISFIEDSYMESEEERLAALAKVRLRALEIEHRMLLDALFEKWDNEGSGFLDLNEVEDVLFKYKDGMEKAAMKKARLIRSAYKRQKGDTRMSKKEFRAYVDAVIAELPGEKEEVFMSVVAFLTSSVARSLAEQARGNARRKWLYQIQQAAETSGANMEPVYKTIFQVLYKDAESHGNNKKISAYIALLERSKKQEDFGNTVLRYVACTADDAEMVLNKTLHRNMKGVSFKAVEEGKPVHVPRVQYHGSIHFWDTSCPEEEKKGSFLVIPLKNSQNRVFGILGVDTVRDPRERNIFVTHEISFYQGVSKTFGIAYAHVQGRRNILRVINSAMTWIHYRAPSIKTITTYMMEPATDKAAKYVLRKMMTSNKELTEMHSPPAILRRNDNLFRDYLFKCVDSSEVITANVYGERHIVIPLRTPAGQALGMLDINIGQHQELPAHEHQDLQKMTQMIQAACHEILKETSGKTEKTMVLEMEHTNEEKRVDILFHRFMLQDLRECVIKLDQKSFAELRSYKEPPTMVHNILKGVLLLFNPEWAETEEIESWSQCKLQVNTELIRNVSCFDPTARSSLCKVEPVAKYIKGIPRGAVWKHGSVPAEYLYNWAFTCLALLEHKSKL
ncbi:EF-hand calcium-binding domain-containing protein 5 isoform X2 [Protopterus annectens]|nr:EF-hand calcium-binding domain-containing protein 5 isoform X2 [Protopterus annectens]